MRERSPRQRAAHRFKVGSKAPGSFIIGIKLVVFDLDGTLIAHDEPIWKTLHEHFGSDRAKRRDLVRQGIAGEISYEAWFSGDIAMLRDRGVVKSAVVALLSELSPTPGAVELVEALSHRGIKVAVVSGGIGLMLETVIPGVAFDAVFINTLEFAEDGTLAGGTPTAFDRGGKADALRMLARRFGVALDETAFVGDGANDLAIMEAAGLGVAWGPAPPHALLDLADEHRQGNMMQLLDLLAPEGA